MVGLLSILRELITDKEFQRISVFVMFIIAFGTIIFHYIEDWRWLDSLYFCVTTLTTVGYGDFAPKTDAGKIMTILYIIIGIGTLLGYLNVVAKIAIKNKFGLINLLTEKTKDIGGKTIQQVKKVQGGKVEETKVEEAPSKKHLHRQKPSRKFKPEDFSKHRLK
jgi:hypothetical protein